MFRSKQYCSLVCEKYKSFIDFLKAKVRVIKIESFTLVYAYRHVQTPWYAKILIIITLGYLLSPIDLIPDFIPILGYLDDLVIVPLLIILSIKLIPNHVVTECREKAQEQLNTVGKPKKTAWWFAVLIVVFYAMMIYFLICWLKWKWFSSRNISLLQNSSNEVKH
jgi:uncharacterized membrane protein YkvA (DUF1232 family)